MREERPIPKDTAELVTINLIYSCQGYSLSLRCLPGREHTQATSVSPHLPSGHSASKHDFQPMTAKRGWRGNSDGRFVKATHVRALATPQGSVGVRLHSMSSWVLRAKSRDDYEPRSSGSSGLTSAAWG